MPFVSRHLKLSIRKQNRRAGTVNNADQGTPSAFIFLLLLLLFISPQLVY